MTVCEFCDNEAYAITPGGDYVCKGCGETIIENAWKAANSIKNG